MRKRERERAEPQRRQRSRRGGEKVNLIEYGDEERSSLEVVEVKRATREEEEGEESAAEKAAFGLAGLMHSQRYTARD